MIKAMLIAGAGGFVGTCGRYLVGKMVFGDVPWSLPDGDIHGEHHRLLPYRPVLRPA